MMEKRNQEMCQENGNKMF